MYNRAIHKIALPEDMGYQACKLDSECITVGSQPKKARQEPASEPGLCSTMSGAESQRGRDRCSFQAIFNGRPEWIGETMPYLAPQEAFDQPLISRLFLQGRSLHLRGSSIMGGSIYKCAVRGMSSYRSSLDSHQTRTKTFRAPP